MKDITLIFPPQWVPDHPYLSVPVLSSFLEEKGFNSVQKDVNLMCYDYFLSRTGLEFYYDLLEKKSTDGNEKIMKKRKFYHTIGDMIIKNVESAKFNLQNGKKIFEAFTLLRTALEMISSTYDSSVISLDSYETQYSPYSIHDINSSIRDSENNIFQAIFSNHIVPALLHTNPHLFAISITHTSQLIPGLTLASELKDQGDHPFIVAGGPFFSAYSDSWKRLKPLFEYIDSIIFFDGETALASLIERIEGGRDLSSVPNILYREGDHLRR
ncbi:MAG: hypothetical protein HXS53_06490, partial [Theionarchaea archaeon]|nr:hypothetical protein [Theionarchaea archaeon]